MSIKSIAVGAIVGGLAVTAAMHQDTLKSTISRVLDKAGQTDLAESSERTAASGESWAAETGDRISEEADRLA